MTGSFGRSSAAEVSYKGTWRSGTLSVGVDLGYRFGRSDHGPSEIPWAHH